MNTQLTKRKTVIIRRKRCIPNENTSIPAPVPKCTITNGTSNFSFLVSNWPVLYNTAKQAQKYLIDDPIVASFYSRKALELIFREIGKRDNRITFSDVDNLKCKIECIFQESLYAKATIIRSVGNKAIHESQQVTSTEAQKTINCLMDICRWFAKNYS
jgi:hypothetical protein